MPICAYLACVVLSMCLTILYILYMYREEIYSHVTKTVLKVLLIGNDLAFISLGIVLADPHISQSVGKLSCTSTF